MSKGPNDSHSCNIAYNLDFIIMYAFFLLAEPARYVVDSFIGPIESKSIILLLQLYCTGLYFEININWTHSLAEQFFSV